MGNYITLIHINQIFHLKDLDIPVSTGRKQHLPLTGKNGSGKTTLMNAIMEFIEKIYLDKSLSFLEYEKNLQNVSDSLERFRKERDSYNIAKYGFIVNIFFTSF